MGTLPASFVNYPEYLVIESKSHCIDCKESPIINKPNNWVIHTPYGSSHPSHRDCAERKYLEQTEGIKCIQTQCLGCHIPIKHDWSRPLQSFSWIREGIRETRYWLFHGDKLNMLRQYRNLTADQIRRNLELIMIVALPFFISEKVVYLTDAISLIAMSILLGTTSGETQKKSALKLEIMAETGLIVLAVSATGAVGVIVGAIKVQTALAIMLSTLGHAIGFVYGLINKGNYLTLGLSLAVTMIQGLGLDLPPEVRERRLRLWEEMDLD